MKKLREREHPIPTPPIYETASRGDPPPQTATAPPERDRLKHRASNLTQRVPSRRGSLAESTTSQMDDCPAVVKTPQRAYGDVPPTSANVNCAPVSVSVGQVAPGVIRRGDTVGLTLPQLGLRRPLARVSCLLVPVLDALNATLYPDFPRPRFVPPRHQVATEEIDRELLLSDDKDTRDMALVAALVKKQAGEEEKDDVWSRLGELAAFALVGFRSPTCKVGACTYNRESKSTALRQSSTDRDAFWDMGIRAPLVDRFFHSSDALTRGGLQDAPVSGDTVLLSDFHPRPRESYDSFAVTGGVWGGGGGGGLIWTPR